MNVQSSPLITQAHRQQYWEEGYFIIENAIPSEHLQMRRAHVTQYSAEPIYKPGTQDLMHLAVPFLCDDNVVYSPPVRP